MSIFLNPVIPMLFKKFLYDINNSYIDYKSDVCKKFADKLRNDPDFINAVDVGDTILAANSYRSLACCLFRGQYIPNQIRLCGAMLGIWIPEKGHENSRP